jgi:hypothetical protein
MHPTGVHPLDGAKAELGLLEGESLLCGVLQHVPGIEVDADRPAGPDHVLEPATDSVVTGVSIIKRPLDTKVRAALRSLVETLVELVDGLRGARTVACLFMVSCGQLGGGAACVHLTMITASCMAVSRGYLARQRFSIFWMWLSVCSSRFSLAPLAL